MMVGKLIPAGCASSLEKGFAVAGALFGLATMAWCSSLQQMSLEKMTAAATEIVRGTVSASYVARSGSTIFTHYTVAVSERMKGPDNPVADVAVPGGSLQGIRQSYPGVPALETGKQYLLFLWTGPTGPTQPVGFSQGVLEVSAGGQGTEVARRAVSETMLDEKGRAVADRAVRLPLSEARTRIGAAMKSQGTGAKGRR